MISEKIRRLIRDVPDFPKPGIVFKDITPILQDPLLCSAIADEFVRRFKGDRVDAVAGIESRGFLFGLMVAGRLGVPFVPVRKQGKLPFKTIGEPCELEYGSAVLEMHQDAIRPGNRVLIHDDLLATGGTVSAASRLVAALKGTVAGYCFIVSLDFLEGRSRLAAWSDNIAVLAPYP